MKAEDVTAPLRAHLMSAECFRALMASAPRPDEDFADDVRAIRTTVRPPDAPD